ncbi:MAG: DUF3800 domain-containing protein [Desulforudis sp.]|jgi:hypothetical protein|nr:MAG: DUF3800 domain-containing protein [Desulforudis sp.]
MHFYYLDEAGCTGKDLGNTEQPIFVLGGISVRDEGWNSTQESMAKIIEKYFSGAIPQNFELHAEHLLSPDGDGPFSGHARERRNNLAKSVLGLLEERSHDVHLYAIDKAKLKSSSCCVAIPYDTMTPYHIAYDYLITYINWFVRNQLGSSARGMLIIDAKEQFQADIERITRARRFEGAAAHRIKWIVEFSYPIDSQKNPMVQLSDLVVFCAKKFLEIDNGYRESYSEEIKKFYAECYLSIHNRIRRKELIDRQGRGMNEINRILREVRSKPNGHWKRRYGY